MRGLRIRRFRWFVEKSPRRHARPKPGARYERYVAAHSGQEE